MGKKGVLTKEEEKEVKKILEKKEEIVVETAISWDGKRLLVRIPREIEDFLDLKSRDRFKKNFLFKIKEDATGKVTKEFDIVERTKPKRKLKNAKNKTTA